MYDVCDYNWSMHTTYMHHAYIQLLRTLTNPFDSVIIFAHTHTKNNNNNNAVKTAKN